MLELKEDVTIKKRSFQKFKLYYSGRAAKHKAYQCYFDKQTIFKDSLFYDFSLSFDLAFNLNFEGLNSCSCRAKYNPTVKLG
jgi:hypothetical protein